MKGLRVPFVLLITLVFLLSLVPVCSYAAETGKAQEQVISDKDLKELVKTLEDPKKRNQLIKTLKALSIAQRPSEVEKKEEGPLVPEVTEIAIRSIRAMEEMWGSIREGPQKALLDLKDLVSERSFTLNMLALLLSGLAGLCLVRWKGLDLGKTLRDFERKKLALLGFFKDSIPVLGAYVTYHLFWLFGRGYGEEFTVISYGILLWFIYTVLSSLIEVLGKFMLEGKRLSLPDGFGNYVRRLKILILYLMLYIYLSSNAFEITRIRYFFLLASYFIIIMLAIKATRFINDIGRYISQTLGRKEHSSYLIALIKVSRIMIICYVWLSVVFSIAKEFYEIKDFYVAITKTIAVVVFIVAMVNVIRWIYDIVKNSTIFRKWSEDVGPLIAVRLMNLLRGLLYFCITFVGLLYLSDIWGSFLGRNIYSYIATGPCRKVFNVVVVIAVSVGIYRLAGFLSYLALEGKLSIASDVGRRRIKTLMPVLENGIKVAVVFVGGVITLKYLGVDVAPILAGAGIVGLAVGFGAQTFVKDLINGLFILFEEAFHVGDVVSIAGKSGVVEMMGIRTTRLRDMEGNVHVIPNSQIEIISNMTKGFSYALMDIGVAYKEDVDRVMGVLRGLGEEMKGDPNWSTDILEPLEVLGLDRLEDSQVVIRARFKTRPLRQWAVKREFLRRVKKRFDELEIEIPFPHLTVFMGQTKGDSTADVRPIKDLGIAD